MSEPQVIHIHHHNIENHAASYNEGYDAAMAHQLMSDEEIEHKSPDEWFADKVRALVADLRDNPRHAGYIENVMTQQWDFGYKEALRDLEEAADQPSETNWGDQAGAVL